MTILNQNKNVSEDYTFIINVNEFFMTNPVIYLYQNNSWSTLSSGSNFNDKYETIQSEILNNHTLLLLSPDADIATLIEQHVSNATEVYIGIKTSNQVGFPNITNGQAFITFINDTFKACMPTKLSSLENIKVVETSDYTPNDKEYLSAKQIYDAISTNGGGGGGGGTSNVTIVTSWSGTLSDSKVASEKLVKNSLDTKVGTADLKTINGESLLGGGNMTISGGGGGSSIDIVTSWEQTPSNSKVASEKLVKDTIDDLIGSIIDYIED